MASCKPEAVGGSPTGPEERGRKEEVEPASEISSGCRYRKFISVRQNRKQDVGFPLRDCVPKGKYHQIHANTVGEAVLLGVRAQALESNRLLC